LRLVSRKIKKNFQRYKKCYRKVSVFYRKNNKLIQLINLENFQIIIILIQEAATTQQSKFLLLKTSKHRHCSMKITKNISIKISLWTRRFNCSPKRYYKELWQAHQNKMWLGYLRLKLFL